VRGTFLVSFHFHGGFSMFAQYFVRVAFVVIMVWGLFFLPGVAYGQIIFPTHPVEIPLIPLKWAFKEMGKEGGAAAAGTVHEGPVAMTKAITGTLFGPIISGISLIFTLWCVLLGVRIFRAAIGREDS
jgi:hypothetical protein